MHYFEAEAKFGLGPLKSGLWGRNKVPVLQKYFSTLICEKLLQLWQDLAPDYVQCFFIDGKPIIDYSNGPRTLESAIRIFKKRASQAKDVKTIYLIFFKQYEKLEIAQLFWLGGGFDRNRSGY